MEFPLFAIGFKAKPCIGAEMIKKEFESAFLMDLIFGSTTKFYQDCLRAGLINSSFESETLDGDGYFVNLSRENQTILKGLEPWSTRRSPE